MTTAYRLATKIGLWALLGIAILAVGTAPEWGPIVVHRLAAMGSDATPGARVQPTADQMAKAHASALRRRGAELPVFPGEYRGPTVQQVMDAYSAAGADNRDATEDPDPVRPMRSGWTVNRDLPESQVIGSDRSVR